MNDYRSLRTTMLSKKVDVRWHMHRSHITHKYCEVPNLPIQFVNLICPKNNETTVPQAETIQQVMEKVVRYCRKNSGAKTS